MPIVRMIAVLLLSAACGPRGSSTTTTTPASLPASENLSSFDDQATAYEADVLNGRDSGGYVVGTAADGSSPLGQGDGAFRTSLATLSMPCDHSAPLVATLLHSISDNGGMIPRHDPPVEAATGPTSRDQVTAVALAFVDRWRRCLADRDALRAAWASHAAYVAAQGRLGPTADGDLLTFRWLWGAIGQYLGVGATGGGSKQEWELGMMSTATSINAGHQACYPIHIGTLQLIAAAWIGQPASPSTRSAFCDATRGTNLPLTEWYCGRSTARDYLAAFRPDVWQLASQRCPGWETPDVNAGDHWPSVGFLESYALARGTP